MNGDYLRKAGALMEAHGMTKWTCHDPQERMCALGALDRAMYGNTFSPTFVRDRVSADGSVEVRVLADVMSELYPDRTTGWGRNPVHVVASTNNHHDTTLEDVLVAFEKAAMRMDEVGALALTQREAAVTTTGTAPSGYEALYTWRFSERSLLIRLYLFVYGDEKRSSINFCKLFWGTCFLPVTLPVTIIVMFLFGDWPRGGR